MKRVVPSILTLTCAMMVAGGCAKQELVKKDDQLAPAATAAAPAKAASTPAQPAQQNPTSQQAVARQAANETTQQANGSEQLTASLDKIYFAFDSNVLSDEARATLAKNAAYLKQNKGVTVRIEGNCDERGSDEYNLALGEKRAQAARHYLITLGTPADRLSVISYGKEKPADQGHSEEAWAKNRRDEFVQVKR